MKTFYWLKGNSTLELIGSVTRKYNSQKKEQHAKLMSQEENKNRKSKNIMCPHIFSKEGYITKSASETQKL